MQKKSIFICLLSILLVLVFIQLIWLNYAPIIDYPFQELQYIVISVPNSEYTKYTEITIEDVEKKRAIYNTLKKAKIIYIDRGFQDECGSDNGWYLMLHFANAVECYDSGVHSKEYVCRKYIRNPNNSSIEGVLLIYSKELFALVEEYLMQ